MAITQKITPNLWYDSQAEEAANLYVSIFKNSSIKKIVRYTEEGFEIHQRPAGSVMTVEFELEGQTYVGLNGGPVFQFSEAISFIVNCETQEEVDYYWEKLSEGGDSKVQQCGWLKDRFGLSWQIVPNILDKLLADPDVQKANRAMRAMLSMKKLNIAELVRAHKGE